MKRPLLCLACFVLAAGCFDTAARQQQAENARRQQVESDLKELGEQMHKEQDGTSQAGSTTEK
jgi:hypothetical protein